MTKDTMIAAWGDVRTGVLNIWFTKKNVVAGSSAGVQNIVCEKLPDVHIYPNPASNAIVVSGEGLENICIYNLIGRIVLRRSIEKESMTIDISKLPPGAYVATVQTKVGLVSQKFIRN